MAERRAPWVWVAASLVLLLALPSVACVCLVGYFDGFDREPPLPASDYAVPLAWCALLVAGVVALSRAASRLSRRARTPLPVSPVDPLATYREAPPPECPRHPFAR